MEFTAANTLEDSLFFALDSMPFPRLNEQGSAGQYKYLCVGFLVHTELGTS